ncbi:MAG: metal ABC transporter permease [Trueperaceae bacterium]|nr:metal ABC transporter permease [Trueperaceae bacterium]
MDGLFALLGDYTVQNVVIGAALLGVSSGVLGTYAVLREQSLLGDTLSHAALPGVCLGFIVAGGRHLGSILAGALVTGAAAALLMLLLTRRSRLKTDAALGISLSVFFALGVVLLTYIQGTRDASQGGLDAFLFGQAAATLRSDLWVMGTLTLLALALVAALWKEFELVTFDPVFAGSLGLPVRALETVLTLMIALAIVIGLQMVGVVLMASMVIAPAVAARQWSRRLGQMVVLAAVFGAAGGVAGALASASGRNLATGPLVVLAISVLVAVSLLVAPRRGLLWEAVRRRRNRLQLRGQRVLATLYRLSGHHDDPRYPVEQGMVNAYFGLATDGILARLEAHGLVRRVPHLPEEGIHWELTEAGRREAERMQDGLGREDDGRPAH